MLLGRRGLRWPGHSRGSVIAIPESGSPSARQGKRGGAFDSLTRETFRLGGSVSRTIGAASEGRRALTIPSSLALAACRSHRTGAAAWLTCKGRAIVHAERYDDDRSDDYVNGHDLTIEQIVNVARRGAKVQLSADARQRAARHYGLLLEATAEGVSIYWFNRAQRQPRKRFCSPAMPCRPRTSLESSSCNPIAFIAARTAGFGPRSWRRRSFAP